MVADIVKRRLFSQQLAFSRFTNPTEIVSWFGALQAQDFAAAKWAIALRAMDLTDSNIEQAFNDGKILRTHIMRPTWHFVAPSDIRWLLQLTSPRVHRYNGYYYRRSGFDRSLFQKSNEILRSALQGSKQLTRDELRDELEKHKIPTQNLGLSYTIMQAELDGIICSGPRIGKQFTYMLLDERVPKKKEFTGDEALSELIKRYFQSHGPAQLRDFVWWSGLTVADAKRGIEIMGSHIQKIEREGKIYWYIASGSSISSILRKTSSNGDNQNHECFLIPGFDEYFIAYKDRSDVLDKKYAKHLNQGGGMVNGAIIIDGKMVGGWKRTFERKNVFLRLQLFEEIAPSMQRALGEQAQRYGKFINMPVSFKVKSFPV